jgi:hypothetical protein
MTKAVIDAAPAGSAGLGFSIRLFHRALPPAYDCEKRDSLLIKAMLKKKEADCAPYVAIVHEKNRAP